MCSNRWRIDGSISESSACRLLNAADPIAAPALVVIPAADGVRDKVEPIARPGSFRDDHGRYILRRGFEPPDHIPILLILLEKRSLPGGLERQVEAFVDCRNNRRYHESLGNPTPADVDHRRGARTLSMREEIEKQPIRKRRLQHQNAAA